MKGFLVADTVSGVGKTTVTLALIACLRRRGLAVQPFKGGADFLDTTHHSRIAGRAARNLDTWMLTPEANREVLRQACADADAVVVEGMMGLFDGKDGLTEMGSSAEIAKLLKLPVLLVIDAAKSARSVAAVALGFESFDPELRLAGIILNRVGSDQHLTMLRQAIAERCATPVLGSLPREPTIAIPKRHLGLHAANLDMVGLEAQIDALAALAETHLDVAAIVQLQCGEFLKPSGSRKPPALAAIGYRSRPQVRIGVPRHRALLFYYEDNLDLLREQEAEIVPSNLLEDTSLPPDLDALYLGGGYPELYAAELSGNRAMRGQIRQFVASGSPVYAECGGMLYLADELKTQDGTAWPMVGALPLRMEMSPRLVDFGYVTVTFTRNCMLGTAGTTIRGHSFHYSRLADTGEAMDTSCMDISYSVQYSLSGKVQVEGYGRGDLLASYVHLHFRANPEIAAGFVAAIRRSKALKQAQEEVTA